MSTLTLQRNVQFMYEEQLARVEMQALGCEGWERDADNPWLVNVGTNGVAGEVLNRSAYVGALDDNQTVYAQLIRPKYQGGEFTVHGQLISTSPTGSIRIVGSSIRK